MCHCCFGQSRNKWKSKDSDMGHFYEQNANILGVYREWTKKEVNRLKQEREKGTDDGLSLTLYGTDTLYDSYYQTLSHLLPMGGLPLNKGDKLALKQEELIAFHRQIWGNAYAYIDMKFLIFFLFFLVTPGENKCRKIPNKILFKK